MKEFLNNAFVGVFIGAVIGFFAILILYTSNLSEMANYTYFKQGIDNNLSVKAMTFKKFPNKYKMDYTDWKDLK